MIGSGSFILFFLGLGPTSSDCFLGKRVAFI